MNRDNDRDDIRDMNVYINTGNTYMITINLVNGDMNRDRDSNWNMHRE